MRSFAMARRTVWGLTAAVAVLALAYLTSPVWMRAIAAGLVCEPSDASSDVILIDLLENNHQLFQRARQLQEQGHRGAVLVPVLLPERDAQAKAVALGFVEVMCRVAGVTGCETFSVPETEPFSLNLARRAGEEIRARGARSATVIASGFRSRRAAAVYQKVLSPLGIAFRCQPVFGSRTIDSWARTNHGIQDLALQTGKLLYYRLIVLPGVR